MSAFSFKLPDLGEGIVESEIAVWRVDVGDQIEEDDVIAEVETDKAVVEVGAPVSGKVLRLGCEAGDVLEVGAELILLETDEVEATGDEEDLCSLESASASVAKSANELVDESDPGVRSKAAHNSAEVFRAVLASPSLRKRALEEGINLEDVPGSGPRGRISHEDFDAFVAAGGPIVQKSPEATATFAETVIKLSGARRGIARKMSESKRTIPHYSYIEEVDVTELEKLRQYLNGHRSDDQPKLTLLPFFARALVKLLPQFPHCNARFDTEAETLTQFEAVHLGIATMTDRGLMVPVVRHTESMDAWGLAAETGRVTGLARDGKATPSDLSGSTISITSLGAIGGLATTPVINAPETSIIGINKMQRRPMVIEDKVEIRTMMNISASFDHRVVDGYDGAQMVQSLKSLLENPGAIFV